jgi:hypothetical protein
MYTSVGAQTHATGRVPGESAKVDHATTSTQTTFFFAPEASRVDVSIFYTGTWFFIQKQVWCLLENLVPVQIHDMHAFTSALGGMVNGVKCIGLARLLGHKNKPHGNNDTYIRAVMVTAGEIIILPSVYTLKYNTLHPRAKYISSRWQLQTNSESSAVLNTEIFLRYKLNIYKVIQSYSKIQMNRFCKFAFSLTTMDVSDLGCIGSQSSGKLGNACLAFVHNHQVRVLKVFGVDNERKSTVVTLRFIPSYLTWLIADLLKKNNMEEHGMNWKIFFFFVFLSLKIT